MTETKASHDSLSAAPHARRAALAMRTAAIFAIILGLLLAVLGARFMSDAASDVSSLLVGATPNGIPWILLIGVALLCAGIAALWPAFRRRPE